MDALRSRPLTLTERFLQNKCPILYAYLLGVTTVLSLGLQDEFTPAMSLTVAVVHFHQDSSYTNKIPLYRG